MGVAAWLSEIFCDATQVPPGGANSANRRGHVADWPPDLPTPANREKGTREPVPLSRAW